MAKLWHFGIVALAGLAAIPGASANDSAAELSVGGLVFTRSADVSMESEELTITPETVTVQVPIPQPERQSGHADGGVSAARHRPLGGRQLRLSGRRSEQFRRLRDQGRRQAGPLDDEPARHARRQGCQRGAASGRRCRCCRSAPIRSAFRELPQAARDRLINEGLLVPVRLRRARAADLRARLDGEDVGGPPADVSARASRSRSSIATGPASASASIPSCARACARTRRWTRKSSAIARNIAYRTSSADARQDGRQHRGEHRRSCRSGGSAMCSRPARIGPGRSRRSGSWSTRARPERLVSFCAPNIKTMSPTAVEFKATDFTPDKDLRILIVGRS